jgi:hypothetical protein
MFSSYFFERIPADPLTSAIEQQNPSPVVEDHHQGIHSLQDGFDEIPLTP